MSQPIAYSPAYNFTSFQAASPSTPLPADKLDTELQALKTTTDSVRVNMALLQADDGTLKGGVVTTTSLSAGVLAVITALAGTIKGAWVTATAYVIKDVVTQGSGTYIAPVAHTAGVFATDLAAGKWILLAGSSGTVALSALSDVNIAAIADDQLLTYDSGTSKWINTLLTDDMVTAGTLSFASHATAFSVTSTTLSGASNTNVPTTTAIKAYVDAQVTRGTGTPVASATTTSLSGNTFDFIHVTGTTTINALTLATDEMCWVIFDGILTLTHNATSLDLPGGANITTAAKDRALFRGIDGTNVKCLAYIRADGQSIVSSSVVKKYQFTDATDIVLSQPNTQSNIGTARSLAIPAKGLIELFFTGEIITGGTNALTLAIRIGSTNYIALLTASGTLYLGNTFGAADTIVYKGGGNVVSSSAYNRSVFLDIEALSIPTGTQTVQPIAFMDTSTITIKGTVVTSRIYMTIHDHTA